MGSSARAQPRPCCAARDHAPACSSTRIWRRSCHKMSSWSLSSYLHTGEMCARGVGQRRRARAACAPHGAAAMHRPSPPPASTPLIHSQHVVADAVLRMQPAARDHPAVEARLLLRFIQEQLLDTPPYILLPLMHRPRRRHGWRRDLQSGNTHPAPICRATLFAEPLWMLMMRH